MYYAKFRSTSKLFLSFIWKKKFSNKRKFQKTIKSNIMCRQRERAAQNMINVFEAQEIYYINRIESVNSKYRCIFMRNIPDKRMGSIRRFQVLEAKAPTDQLKGLEFIQSTFWKKKSWKYELSKERRESNNRLDLWPDYLR